MPEEGQPLHSITLGNREISLRREMVPISELRFYEHNPRVHSVVWRSGDIPDQEAIEKSLRRMEHVKQLIQSIKANGGVTDPLLVRKSDMVVLEGNSRLAAYCALSDEDAAKWGKVKCDIIDEGINDDDVFALLVQYHIVGKKDWEPFEQAGLFWRRYREGANSSQIAKDVAYLGISPRRVTEMVNVYSFMVTQKDIDSGRWSYYEQYLKSRSVQKAREEHECLDNIVVKQIKSGQINRAVDVRQKLDVVCRVGGRTLMSFIEEKTFLDTAYSRAEARYQNKHLITKLEKIREFISSPEAREAVQSVESFPKCRSELRRIHKAVARLLQDIEKGLENR